MSPAFINRFDVIVLENQIEKICHNDFLNLISYLFISFDKIPKKNKIFEKNKELNNNSKGPFKGGKNDNNLIVNDIIEESNSIIIEQQKELLEKEKPFLIKLIEKILFKSKIY